MPDEAAAVKEVDVGTEYGAGFSGQSLYQRAKGLRRQRQRETECLLISRAWGVEGSDGAHEDYLNQLCKAEDRGRGAALSMVEAQKGIIFCSDEYQCVCVCVCVCVGKLDKKAGGLTSTAPVAL